MIIPYSTDAPIYHYPKATLGMIATNVAVHAAWIALAPEVAKPYAMKLGAGLHPVQWLTHNFLHADILHLLFNMIFLWSYGIIVEGKIGWLSFLLCYLGIGTMHGALIQAAYLHAAEPSYVVGASAIIFGLMAMCMVWAPVNDLSCFYLFLVGFRVISGTFELPIYGFALLQIGLEGLSMLVMFVIHGDPMSSGLLHVSGALWGLVVGIVLLQVRWVDCEGWDAFSMWTKRRALRAAWKAREARLDRRHESENLPRSMRDETDRASLPPEERAAKLLAKIERSIDMGDMDAALSAYKKWMTAHANRPPRDALLAMIKAMHARREWAASILPMRALCRLHPENSAKVRLKLASLLLRKLQRPTEARRHLQQIAPGDLDPSLERHRRQLLAEAEQMIDEGVLELEEDE